MNIQIFGKAKCFDTQKAQRYFKERGIKFQFIDINEKDKGNIKRVERLDNWGVGSNVKGYPQHSQYLSY